jgi:GINS complex subunit 1
MLPPKEPLITVRCLKDVGELVTETGVLQLVMGSQHFVRRSDVEGLIRQGQLEHIVDS